MTMGLRLNGSVIILIAANLFLVGILRGMLAKQDPQSIQICKDVWYYMDGAITATVEVDHSKYPLLPIVKLYERQGNHDTPLGAFAAHMTKQFKEGRRTIRYWGENFELSILEDTKTYLTGFPAKLSVALKNKKIDATLGCHN